MSRTSKLAKKATLSKRSKGSLMGKDDSKKSPYPHMQPKATWMTPKSNKRNNANGRVN